MISSHSTSLLSRFIKSLQSLLAFLVLAPALLAAPANYVQTVTHEGETITMRLSRHDLRGAHFELWTQNASGSYDVVTPVAERSYIGSVDEYPGAVSCGILKDDGTFWGAVYFDRGVAWRTLGTSVTSTEGTDYVTDYRYPSTFLTAGQAGTDVHGFDMGVDANYEYFSVKGGGDVATTFEKIEYSMVLARTIYLRDTMLRAYLGRVIIRTNQAHDPEQSVTNDWAYLADLKARWKSNHADSNFDFVVGVADRLHNVGGLADHRDIGSITMSSENGDFSLIFTHELGHNWGLSHTEGNSPEGQTVVSGNSLARMSGPEVTGAFKYRDALNQGGTLVKEGFFGEKLPPYAGLDSGEFTQSVTSSLTFDVLANDHDANGHSLSIASFDATSTHGGSIVRQGDSLVYTASSSFRGLDYFFYTIADSSGQKATGVVIVNVKTPDHLLSYFRLDETSGTAAKDSSSYGEDGQFFNGDFGAASVAGKFGNAVQFDGVNDQITITGPRVTSNTVTFSAWVKVNASQAGRAGIVFDRGGYGAGLTIDEDGTLNYKWRNKNYDSGFTPPVGVWTFVALVVEPDEAIVYMHSGSGFQTYVNTVSHPAHGIGGYTGIGRDPGSSVHFNGAIDDVRLYSESLALSDLQKLYEGGGALHPVPFDGATNVQVPQVSWEPSSASASYDIYLGTNEAAVMAATRVSSEYLGNTTAVEWPLTLQTNTEYFWRVDVVTASTTISGDVWKFETGDKLFDPTLIAHWEMEELHGNSVEDSSYRHNDATISGATATSGSIAAALAFDGVNDGLTATAASSLSGETDFTLSAWVKTSANTEGVILQQRDVAGFDGQYQLRMNSNGTVAFYTYRSGAYSISLQSSATINDGIWHHVLARREGGNGAIYIDGVLAVSSTNTTSDFLDATISVAIGHDVRDGNKFFNGAIDDVRIYQRALRASDITTLVQVAPVIADNAFSIDETSAVHAQVGTIPVFDPNSGESHTFQITSGNSGGAFTIDTSGVLRTATALDFLSQEEYELTVQVTDSGVPALRATAQITVRVNDVYIDSDGDNIDDHWESAYFGNLTSSHGATDSDNDGQSDPHEYAAGTNPTDAGDFLKITAVEPVTDEATVKWTAKAGKSYRIEYSYNLSDWNVVASSQSGASAELSYVDRDAARASASKVFYRVVVE